MAVKLVLTNTANPDLVEEFVFDQQQISIGRDKVNDLHISDPNRVVSKRHAEIVRSDEGYEISDLGSKNFTYLNSSRLESGKTYLIDDGDTFKLGEFEIQFSVLHPELESESVLSGGDSAHMELDRTVFEGPAVNPFSEHMDELVSVLQKINRTYEEEPEKYRGDALRDAISDKGVALKKDSIGLLGSILAAHVDPEATDPVLNGARAKPAPVSRGVAPSRALARTSKALIPGDRVTRVQMTTLRVLSTLLSIPWQFRHEFVGHTIAQTPETEILLEGDPELLHQFLSDASLDEKEFSDRLEMIEESGDEVLLHQLAMLDGYKAVVQQGMHMLLREIDPIVAAESLAQNNGFYRTFPKMSQMLASLKLKDKFEELRGEDWSVTERRAYRPSFIRAYLARMSSGPKRGLSS